MPDLRYDRPIRLRNRKQCGTKSRCSGYGSHLGFARALAIPLEIPDDLQHFAADTKGSSGRLEPNSYGS